MNAFKEQDIWFDGRFVRLICASNEIEYKRLKAQISKQLSSSIFYDKFHISQLVGELPDQRGFMLELDQDLKRVADWVCSTPPQYCSWFHSELAGYFKHIFQSSIRDKFDHLSFNEKVIEMSNNVFSNPTINKIHDGKNRILKLTKHLLKLSDDLIGKQDFHGWCHGNLTLDSLMVNPEKMEVSWSRFMDRWDHSPLIDVANALQEMRYQWSLRYAHHPTKAMINVYKERMEELSKTLLEVMPQDLDWKMVNAYLILNDLCILQAEQHTGWFERILSNVEKT